MPLAHLTTSYYHHPGSPHPPAGHEKFQARTHKLVYEHTSERGTNTVKRWGREAGEVEIQVLQEPLYRIAEAPRLERQLRSLVQLPTNALSRLWTRSRGSPPFFQHGTRNAALQTQRKCGPRPAQGCALRERRAPGCGEGNAPEHKTHPLFILLFAESVSFRMTAGVEVSRIRKRIGLCKSSATLWIRTALPCEQLTSLRRSPQLTPRALLSASPLSLFSFLPARNTAVEDPPQNGPRNAEPTAEPR